MGEVENAKREGERGRETCNNNHKSNLIIIEHCYDDDDDDDYYEDDNVGDSGDSGIKLQMKELFILYKLYLILILSFFYVALFNRFRLNKKCHFRCFFLQTKENQEEFFYIQKIMGLR